MRAWITLILLASSLTLAVTAAEAAVPGLMAYQGVLLDDSGHVVPDGPYPLIFRIYDNSTGGAVLWTSQDTAMVENGVFSVLLGENTSLSDVAFSAPDRWLETELVGQGPYLPRTRIGAVAYAFRTATVAGATGGEIIGNLQVHALGFAKGESNEAGATISTSPTVLTVGDGSGNSGQLDVTDGSATTISANGASGSFVANGLLGGGVIPASGAGARLMWYPGKSAIRAGRVTGTQWDDVNTGDESVAFGTDSRASGFHATVGGGSGNAATAENATVTGGESNSIGANGKGSSIGGGEGNTVSRPLGTVTGGMLNTIDGDTSAIGGGALNHVSGTTSAIAGGFANAIGVCLGSAIGGGHNNQTAGNWSVVSGGTMNHANQKFTVVSGGRNNVATDSGATIGGGENNLAGQIYATIGGGKNNSATDTYATVGGGIGNKVTDFMATIGGGRENVASTSHATVSGGMYDTASGSAAAVGGGYSNVSSGLWSTVAGGGHNRSTWSYGAIGGGQYNTASGFAATVAGGENNVASAQIELGEPGGGHATVGGGEGNASSGDWATIGGGSGNTADSEYSTIGGGASNSATGAYATIPGGRSNAAIADYSFAGGRRSKANHRGTFVWGDSTNADFASTATNQFLIRASGGVGIGSGFNAPSAALDVDVSSILSRRAAEFRNNYAAGGVAAATVTVENTNAAGIAINATANSSDAAVVINNTTVGGTLLRCFGPGFGVQFEVQSDGAVGIGTGTPSEKLQVVGDLKVGTSGTNGCIKRFDGVAIAGTCASDRRLKKDIHPFEPLLDRVAKLEPVRFHWRTAEYPERRMPVSEDQGLIAQDVEALFPDLVITEKDGFQAVHYNQLPLMAIQAIKELKGRNDELRSELDQLKAQMKAILDRLDGDPDLASFRTVAPSDQGK